MEVVLCTVPFLAIMNPMMACLPRSSVAAASPGSSLLLSLFLAVPVLPMALVPSEK